MNVLAVESAAAKAVSTIRETGKPYFMECLSYRFKGHSMFDTELYRSEQEVNQWKQNGPIQQLIDWLGDNNFLQEGQLADIEKTIEAEIQQAIDFSEQGEWEPIKDLKKDVYTPQADKLHHSGTGS